MPRSRYNTPSLSERYENLQLSIRNQINFSELMSSDEVIIKSQKAQYDNLHDILGRTIDYNESNSVLLMGPHGCGKSLLLTRVLNSFQKDKSDSFLLVKLNGLLHATLHASVKEIMFQLALVESEDIYSFGSFSSILRHLLSVLRKNHHDEVKPIIFVLDFFDIFAESKNQSLLYNLLDVSQSAETPICVIGLTCRLDAIEMLEKRVKSRFSHRQIFLFNTLNFDEYLQLAKGKLSLHHKEREVDERKFSGKFIREWNESVENIFSESAVIKRFKDQYDIDHNICTLNTYLFECITHVDESHPFLTMNDFVSAHNILNVNTKALQLQGLSILELCLIVAMKHYMELHDYEPFNFEQIYIEYRKFVIRAAFMRVVREKDVVLKAFEHLLALEIVAPVSNSSTSGSLNLVSSNTAAKSISSLNVRKEYQLVTLLVDSTEITEAIERLEHCPTELKQWVTTPILA